MYKWVKDSWNKLFDFHEIVAQQEYSTWYLTQTKLILFTLEFINKK